VCVRESLEGSVGGSVCEGEQAGACASKSEAEHMRGRLRWRECEVGGSVSAKVSARERAEGRVWKSM